MAPENKREKALKRIAELGAWYLRLIEGVNDLDLYDINVISEDFFVELFQEVYDYRDLKNLNSESANYPGIDLGDESTGVAVQITTNKRGQKVKETLQKFVANEDYERFPRLIIYIIDKKQASYSDAGWEAIIDGRFEFDPQEDIRDHGDLLRDINALRLEKIQRVEAIFERYFGGNGEDPPLEKLVPYLQTVQRRTQDLPLTGLDQSGEKGSKLDLARVFVGLNVEGRAFDEGEAGDIKGTVTAAAGHVYLDRQLILLGDPGSGKSTLLRYIANCLAGAALAPDDARWREKLSWPVRRAGDILRTAHWAGPAPVPILVVLRDFARQPFDRHDGTAVINHICAQLEADDLGRCRSPLRELARRGQVLFLLDGVDEVPAAERPAVWAAISALSKGVYGGSRWVATCRVLSFDPSEAPNGVPVQTLQPLDEEQIGQFIANWYAGLLESGQVGREQGDLKAAALQAAVQRPALRELAENPMLLTIMALVQTFRGTLPDDRAKLYQACVETLLLRWQMRLEQGGDGEIPGALRELGTTQEDLERLLWAIAWQAHSQAEDRQRSADIPRWDVIATAEAHLGGLARAEQFLAYTEQRAHLLVGRGGRREQVYSFPHRTFQEYLAACHLASQRRFARRARELAVESDDWREVLNLAVGTLAFNQNNREKAFDAVEEMMPSPYARGRRHRRLAAGLAGGRDVRDDRPSGGRKG